MRGGGGGFGPTPGFRDGGIEGALGKPMKVGNSGYSWSTRISSTNSMRLNFNTTQLSPSHAHNRSLGLQLRCLSE